MTLDEAKILIKKTARVRWIPISGKIVFDEWDHRITGLKNKARVLAYVGPRNDDFLQNFANDLGTLRLLELSWMQNMVPVISHDVRPARRGHPV